MFKFKQQFITDEAGHKVAVVIPFKEFQKMSEDLYDLTVAKERDHEKTISLAEMKRKFLST